MIPFWFVIIYYSLRGITHGGVLGLLAGTLVFPLAGTFYGFVWGAAVGFFLGVINGLVAVLAQKYFYDEQLGAENFRVWLIRMTILTTLIIGFLPLFLIFVPVAAVAFAYISHQFVSTHYKLKRKNDNLSSTIQQSAWQMTNFVGLRFRDRALPFVLGGMVIFTISAYQPDDEIGTAIALALMFLLSVLIGLLVIGILNVMLITYLNAIHFRTIHDVEQYRWRIKILMAVVSTLGSVVIAAVIFAPLVGYVAWRVGDDYVDWALGEKAKRKVLA